MLMTTLRRLLRAVLVCSPLALVAADGDCEPSATCTTDTDCQGGTLTCDPPAYPACLGSSCGCTE